MNNNELRKLNRKELLEIILEQAKRIEELENTLKKTQKSLESKKIAIDSVGSIAEACLKLNGIFETAQDAVDQYMLNVKNKCIKMENDTKKECLKLKEETMNEINNNHTNKKKKSTKKETSKKVIQGRAVKSIKKRNVN